MKRQAWLQPLMVAFLKQWMRAVKYGDLVLQTLWSSLLLHLQKFQVFKTVNA